MDALSFSAKHHEERLTAPLAHPEREVRRQVAPVGLLLAGGLQGPDRGIRE